MLYRYCLECQQSLKGRSDKKFCNDACRSSYHNKLHQQQEDTIRKIDGVLKKNRRILAQLNPTGKIKVPKDKLLEHGFNFSYHTHTLRTAKGSTYFFCYEYGYLITRDQEILLVKQRD